MFKSKQLAKGMLFLLVISITIVSGCGGGGGSSAVDTTLASDAEYILNALQTTVLMNKVIGVYSTASTDSDGDLTYTYSGVSGDTTTSFSGTFYNSSRTKIAKDQITNNLPISADGYLSMVDNSNTDNYLRMDFTEQLSQTGGIYFDEFDFTGQGKDAGRALVTASSSLNSNTTDFVSGNITDFDISISTADGLIITVQNLVFTQISATSYTPQTFAGTIKSGSTTVANFTYNMNTDQIDYTDNNGSHTISGQ
jgi:hypothetical protein